MKANKENKRGEIVMERDLKIKFQSVTLDAKDPKALMHFYSDLLGWELTYESDSFATLAAPDGGTGLGAQLIESYKPPVWPPEADGADQGAHCDFQVSDLESAVALALELGAKKADDQLIDNLAVMIDPEGHPFCLFPAWE